MFRCISRLLLLIAAVQILGGHWAVLQTVAWTNMLIDYAQTESFVQAITKTFDGSKPCDLCKVVSEGRHSEEKHATTKVVVKLEAVLTPMVALPAPVVVSTGYPEPALVGQALVYSPSVPPPRFA